MTGSAFGTPAFAVEVLAQLASAPPDLSGLPGDLHEVVAAGLAPDPRDR